MPTIAMRFDLRAPEWAATRHPDLYGACLDQCSWAEEHGAADIVVLSEHHGTDDGYLASPLILAAAIAGRTHRIPINIAALILPLHDPIRLAEHLATADLVSRGRVSVVAGSGYKTQDLEMAGVDRQQRGALLEECLETMRQAWTGQPFEYRGRTSTVTPRPYTQPHPMILLGGSSGPAARRAARLRLGFLPAVADEGLQRAYLEEAAATGFGQPFCLMPHGANYVFVSADPERAWAQVEPYAWYDAQTYRSWQTPGTRSEVTSRATSPAELREEGIYRVLTPDQCVELADELGPAGTIVLHPLLCGLPLELSWESLELFRTDVLPRIRPT